MKSVSLGSKSRAAGGAVRCLVGVLVLGALFGCASSPAYGSAVPSGVRPASTELRAAYCNEVWRRETEKDRASRSTGRWLLGLGVGAGVGGLSTLYATTQTERKQTDKTLKTLSASLGLAALSGIVSGTIVLGVNDHDDKARNAALHTTDIVAEGEKPIDEKKSAELKDRNAATLPMFRECLGLPKDGGPDTGAETPEADQATAAAKETPAKTAAKPAAKTAAKPAEKTAAKPAEKTATQPAEKTDGTK